MRLKVGWEADYNAWSQRDLSQKRYVYWWADGVYFNIRLGEERTCVLVLIGATEDGTKELVVVVVVVVSSTVTAKALNPGVNFFSNSNAWDFPPHRS